MKNVYHCFITLLSIILVGCDKGDQHTGGNVPKVKIGVVGPFDGPNAHIGKIIFNAVKLQFDRNPISSFKIELVPLDTKSNPSDAVSALQASVPDPDLIGLVAFYHSSTALAGKPIVQEAKIPSLIYSASNPTVTDNAPFYFRLVPTDDNQALVLADYVKKLGKKKIGIFYYADDYGKGLSDGIQARAQENNSEIVDIESYDPGTTDFRPLLTVMKDKAPEVLIVCGFVEKSIAILNQATEQGIKVTFLFGDGTFNEEQLIQGAGLNAEGVYVAAPYVFDETNAKNKDFLESYWAAHPANARSKPASWSAYAYDAAGMFRQALERGHRDRASITTFFRGMNSPRTAYDGVTGLTYFNAKGDAVGRNFRLAVVKNGQFVAVTD